MDLGLNSKNVIVTGGSRGIGRATALAFAAEGANVAICARNADTLAQARAEIAALGVNAFAQPCDVGNAAALTAFMHAANEALGGIDVLVNNPSGLAWLTMTRAGRRASMWT